MKKLSRILVFISLSLFPSISFAQTNFTVKGQIIDGDNYAPSGNIMALNPKDSTLLKGTFFLDGIFELSDLNQSQILLQFSSLEFEDYYMTVKYTNQPLIDLGTISVQKSGLDLAEVVVKSRRPVYTRQPDGTVAVLVENTVLAASNSLSEILSKSPEIVVDESGGLGVFGKGNAILYLNGKRITAIQLTLIAPSNVKKIDIIRNPSAKYDAEGAAVIHITTITQTDDGYQAKLQQNISHSRFGGTNTFSSLNLNHKKGKLSTNANYSVQLGQDRELLHTTRNRTAENVFLSSDLTTDWKRRFDNFSTYGLGLQYNLTKSEAISVAYSGFSEKLSGNTDNQNRIINDSGSNFYTNDINRDEKDINHSLSLNYTKTLDTLGTNLFIGAESALFNNSMDNFITEESVEQQQNSSRLLKNILQLDIAIFSGQADFTKVYKNKNALEFGTKYSYVENDFDFNFLVAKTLQDFELDLANSNQFSYQEAIGAAYVNFKGTFNTTTSYTIGLRSEYTKYDLQLSILENEEINATYFNLFPNVSINRIFSDNYNLNFSYSARINRPPYQMLNPVLVYQDPYTSVQGNAELQPQKTHAFELNSKLKKTSFTLGYSYKIDPFGQSALRGATPSSYILKRINYEKNHTLFASLSRTFTRKWWTSINTLSVSYNNYIDNVHEFQIVKAKPMPYLYSVNHFDISDSFKGEIMFWARGANYDGLHVRNGMYNLTLTLEKSFFDKALKCRFIANDIFHSVVASGDYNVGQTAVYYNRRWSTDYFRLSLSYNFGQLKKVNYKNKAIGQSEHDRAR